MMNFKLKVENNELNWLRNFWSPFSPSHAWSLQVGHDSKFRTSVESSGLTIFYLACQPVGMRKPLCCDGINERPVICHHTSVRNRLENRLSSRFSNLMRRSAAVVAGIDALCPRCMLHEEFDNEVIVWVPECMK